jgi:GT2 family glycosyltransferase
MRVSVVIPTHNRRALLERTLASLARQSCLPYEVIVVADGCTDGTGEVHLEPPLRGIVMTQGAAGPAAARNRGAAAATGDLLLFLDDDVEASPTLVGAHIRAHRDAPAHGIVVGDLPPALRGRRDPFGIMLRGWWDAIFERMRQTGHRFTYADVLTGNCSVTTLLFRSVGGFDESLRCHEDYELGYRVIRAGGQITFAADAIGAHQERTDLRGALARKHAEGAADVALARKHPALWPALILADESRPLSRRARLFRKLAMDAPAVGDGLEWGGRLYLKVLGRARARDRWRRLLDDLLLYWYWRGVAEALEGTTLAEFRRSFDTPHVEHTDLADIDLRAGLARAMQEIDRLSPAGAVLRYGSVHVGTIPPRPWAEPLAGRHLRQLLKTRFATRLAQALVTVHGLGSTPSQNQQ